MSYARILNSSRLVILLSILNLSDTAIAQLAGAVLPHATVTIQISQLGITQLVASQSDSVATLYAQGKYVEALPHGSHDLTMAAAWNQLGLLHRALGKYKAAEQDYAYPLAKILP